jgi:hypothetical protein
MAGHAAAHLAVGRVRRDPGRVADGGRIDTRLFPELAFGSPEAAKTEQGLLGTLREWRLEPGVEHVVLRRNGHTLVAALEGFGGGRRLRFLVEHVLFDADWGAPVTGR